MINASIGLLFVVLVSLALYACVLRHTNSYGRLEDDSDEE